MVALCECCRCMYVKKQVDPLTFSPCVKHLSVSNHIYHDAFKDGTGMTFMCRFLGALSSAMLGNVGTWKGTSL